MKIIKNSIEKLSGDFLNLEQELKGCNYALWFELTKFTYEGADQVTLLNLKEIYSDQNIIGNIIESNIDSTKKIIENCLSWTPDGYGDIYLSKQHDVLAARIKKFWKIISKYIGASSLSFYEFQSTGDYFGEFAVFWGFCFLILDKVNKVGLIVAAEAAD